MPESARWLISVGKYDKAEKVIRKVAEVNNAKLPSPLFTTEFKEEQVQLLNIFLLVFQNLVIFDKDGLTRDFQSSYCFWLEFVFLLSLIRKFAIIL